MISISRIPEPQVFQIVSKPTSPMAGDIVKQTNLTTTFGIIELRDNKGAFIQFEPNPPPCLDIPSHSHPGKKRRSLSTEKGFAM